MREAGIILEGHFTKNPQGRLHILQWSYGIQLGLGFHEVENPPLFIVEVSDPVSELWQMFLDHCTVQQLTALGVTKSILLEGLYRRLTEIQTFVPYPGTPWFCPLWMWRKVQQSFRLYSRMAMCKAGKLHVAYDWLGLSDALTACWGS